jgi:type II secretory pathway pseudopilin PulG
MGLMAVLSAMAIPRVLVGVDRSRTVAAAHYVNQQCGAARIQAIGRSAKVALRFRRQGGDYVMQAFVDRNWNGVRATDINAGIDLPLGPPESLSRNFPGVRIGLAPGLGSDPVKLGLGDLLTFSPGGTATPGSIFVVGKDGTQFAVRVLGATARTRLERYDARRKKWLSTW